MAKSWLRSAAVKKACGKGKWRAKASSFIKCAKAAHGGKKSPRRSGAGSRRSSRRYVDPYSLLEAGEDRERLIGSQTMDGYRSRRRRR
jgi:hypothetical protein